MTKTTFYLGVWCSACLNEDELGCFEGRIEYEPCDSFHEAIVKGRAATDNRCDFWEYSVFVKTSENPDTYENYLLSEDCLLEREPKP